MLQTRELLYAMPIEHEKRGGLAAPFHCAAQRNYIAFTSL